MSRREGNVKSRDDGNPRESSDKFTIGKAHHFGLLLVGLRSITFPKGDVVIQWRPGRVAVFHTKSAQGVLNIAPMIDGNSALARIVDQLEAYEPTRIFLGHLEERVNFFVSAIEFFQRTAEAEEIVDVNRDDDDTVLGVADVNSCIMF